LICFWNRKIVSFYTTLHLLTGVPDGQSDKVELPIAGSYSRFLTLVRDAEGGCHWVFANQVAIRGQNHSKGYFLKPIQQIASIGRRLIIVSPLSGDVLVIVWKP
jgi:hypothetical protein